jgi:hypothetical protein
VSFFAEGPVSFEVFLQCFDGEQPSGVPEDAVRTVFSNFAADSEPDYWHLWYDAANSCHIWIGRLKGQPQMISALTVDRPAGDQRLWDSLYRVLQLGRWVLYFPAKKPPLIVADAAHAHHLPASMREKLGPVQVVRSGGEITQIIRHS